MNFLFTLVSRIWDLRRTLLFESEIRKERGGWKLQVASSAPSPTARMVSCFENSIVYTEPQHSFSFGKPFANMDPAIECMS